MVAIGLFENGALRGAAFQPDTGLTGLSTILHLGIRHFHVRLPLQFRLRRDTVVPLASKEN